MNKCIGIVTGDGDCPGLNAVIQCSFRDGEDRVCASVGDFQGIGSSGSS